MSSPAVAAALSAVGDPGPALSIRPVGGGCINEAYQIETAAGLYFLKTGATDMYHLEAHGLNLLADSNTLAVPRPLHAVDGDHGYLLLPWIETGGRHGDWARDLGHGLAQLHGATEQSFGLDMRESEVQQLPESEEELGIHMQLTYKQNVELAEEQAINTLLDGNKYELIRKRFYYDLTSVFYMYKYIHICTNICQ